MLGVFKENFLSLRRLELTGVIGDVTYSAVTIDILLKALHGRLYHLPATGAHGTGIEQHCTGLRSLTLHSASHNLRALLSTVGPILYSFTATCLWNLSPSELQEIQTHCRILSRVSCHVDPDDPSALAALVDLLCSYSTQLKFALVGDLSPQVSKCPNIRSGLKCPNLEHFSELGQSLKEVRWFMSESQAKHQRLVPTLRSCSGLETIEFVAAGDWAADGIKKLLCVRKPSLTSFSLHHFGSGSTAALAVRELGERSGTLREFARSRCS